MNLRQLVIDYQYLIGLAIAQEKKLWPLHVFLLASGFSDYELADPDRDSLAEYWLKLDGWKRHPNKADVWIPGP